LKKYICLLFIMLLIVCCAGKKAPTLYQQAAAMLVNENDRTRFHKALELLDQIPTQDKEYEAGQVLSEKVFSSYFRFKLSDLAAQYKNALIAFVDENHDLVTANIDNSRLTTIVPHNKVSAPVFNPAWSHDGRSIIFTDIDTLYIVNKDGSNLRKLAELRTSDIHPVFSMDDRKILYSDNGSLFLYDMEKDKNRRLPVSDQFADPLRDPIFLNAQDDILFISSIWLYSCALTGRNLARWIDPQIEDKSMSFINTRYENPVLSIDGKKLAVEHKDRLEIIDTDSREIEYHNLIQDYSWGPDFFVYSNYDAKIFITVDNPGDEDLFGITIPVTSGSMPAWSTGD